MEMEEAVMVTSLFPKVNLQKEKQAAFKDNVNKQPCALSPFFFPTDDDPSYHSPPAHL